MKILSTSVILILLLGSAATAGEEEPAFGGKPLHEWIRQLERGPTGVGKAPDALLAIGAPAVPALRVALMGRGIALRIQAARILGRMGAVARRAVPDLAEMLSDDNSSVRAAAALAVGRVGRALEDASLETVEHLVEAAARLKERLDDVDPAVRTAVLQGMALMGGFSQNDLRALLQHPKRRRDAFAAIAALGPEATPLALNLLQHPSWHVRQWTIEALARAKLDGARWDPALAHATHDRSEAVAYSALAALAVRLAAGGDVATQLLQGFDSPHALVRRWTPMALSPAKTLAEAATPPLLESLRSKDPIAREGAAFALGQSRNERPAVLVALTRALADPVPQVRWGAARSLVTLGERPEAALGPLVGALAESPVPPPYAVVSGSGEPLRGGRKRHDALNRPQPREVWPAILRFGTRGAAYVAAHLPRDLEPRHGFIHALARFGADGIAPLAALLDARERETRRRAALTLSTLPGAPLTFLAPLLQCLTPRPPSGDADGEEIDWHRTALAALERLGPRAVAPALEQLAAARPRDQRRMQRGLGQWLQEVGPPALPELEALRADFELGPWIDEVVLAIKTKAKAKQPAKSGGTRR